MISRSEQGVEAMTTKVFRMCLKFRLSIIELINLSSIDVDAENKTAWIQANATLGELYYKVAEKSSTALPF